MADMAAVSSIADAAERFQRVLDRAAARRPSRRNCGAETPKADPRRAAARAATRNPSRRRFAPPPPPEPVEAIPDRSFWRSILATLPDDVRLRWGILANQLCDEGLLWNVAEWRAFREVVVEPSKPSRE
jgi:hypothetical protein